MAIMMPTICWDGFIPFHARPYTVGEGLRRSLRHIKDPESTSEAWVGRKPMPAGRRKEHDFQAWCGK